MPHAAAKQNGVPADSPCLRRTVQEPIRHSPELGIVSERVPPDVLCVGAMSEQLGFDLDYGAGPATARIYSTGQ